MSSISIAYISNQINKIQDLSKLFTLNYVFSFCFKISEVLTVAAIIGILIWRGDSLLVASI